MIKPIKSYSSPRDLSLILIVSLIYYFVAYSGLLLAFQKTNASPVWPASGIAFSAIILLGHRVWPGIVLGAFFINVFVFLNNGVCDFNTALWASAIIGIGNTTEAFIGYYLLQKYTGLINSFQKAQSVFRFVLITLIMCLASSIVGSLTVCFTEITTWNHYFEVWFTWWLGDITGILIVTPLLLTYATFSINKWKWTDFFEIISLYTIVFLVSEIVFNNWLGVYHPIQRAYILLPLILWAVFRFKQLEVVTVIVISSGIAILGTINGRGPFYIDSLNLSLLSLQSYLSIISVSSLALMAIVEEKKQSENKLLKAQEELKIRVNKRTEELRSSQSEIRDYQNRVDNILNVLLDYTQLDFSREVSLSDKGDETDAIGAGLNVLGSELAFYIQKLKESEEKYRVIIENVKDYAIFMLDPEGTVVSWNDGAENIKEYSSEEILGKHFSVFYEEEDIKNGKSYLNLNSAKKNGRIEYEDWRVRKSGSKFWADVVLTALYDDSDELVGFTKITRDITGRKNTEELLKQKSIELASSNEELERFAYVASHDLQEPLRTISSYVQLIEKRYKGKLDGDADEFIAYAIDGSNRMRSLIQSLLEYARVNRTKPFEKVRIDELLDDVLQDLKKQIKENQAFIKKEILPKIFCDRVLISLLFQNLIGNAIKFRTEKNPEIIISATQIGDMYLFAIKDNGIGIEKEYMAKIFEIFQRLHSRDKYSGTGIGLAICKKIVERHGGRIWVESELNKGSIFYFTLKKIL